MVIEEGVGLNLFWHKEDGKAPVPKEVTSFPKWVFTLMVLAASLIWGGSFVVMKASIGILQPITVVGIRFSVGALVLLAFAFRVIRANWNAKTIRRGLLLGVFWILAYIPQAVGLAYTTPSKSAFIIGAAVVLVPFAYWAISKRKPTLVNVVSVFVCVFGLALVTLEGDLRISFGDAITMFAMISFALHIAFMALFVRDSEVFTLTFVQFAVTGVIGLAAGFAFESQPEPRQLLDWGIIAQLLYLSLVSGLLASLFQNIGQSHVPATQTALILSLQSVFGALFSIIFYGETLTLKITLGFVVIFVAIVGSEILSAKKEEPDG